MRIIFLSVCLFSISFVSMQAQASTTCNTNLITKELCVSLEMFEVCSEGSFECEENRYIGQNMASTLFYLGSIESLAKALKSLGLYSGEIKKRVQEFSEKYENGNSFFVNSHDPNFIVLTNKLNKKVREVAEGVGRL